MELREAGHEQGILFYDIAPDRPKLMAVLDKANVLWGQGTMRQASEGVDTAWKMKRGNLLPSYTTN